MIKQWFNKMYQVFYVVLGLVCFSNLALASSPPVIFFSDLISAPKSGWSSLEPDKGAIVTIWGRNFGTVRGSSYVTVNGEKLTNDLDYKDSWAKINNPVPFLQTITFQLNSSMVNGDGTISVTVGSETSNSIPFRINTIGSIYFVDVNASDGTGTFLNPWSNLINYIDIMAPGDVAYFRAGLYDQKYNGGKSNIWVRSSEASGTAQDPIGFVGYPNEVAMFDSWANGHSSNFNKSILIDSDYVTVAKVSTTAFSRGVQVNDYGRIIGNDAVGVLQKIGGAGIIHVGADGVKILGNAVHGGRSADRLDHSIYVDGCQEVAANEIAYNYSYDNFIDRGPHLVDNHQENRCSSNVYQKSNHWHNNLVSCEADPSRGIGIYDLSWDEGEANEPDTAYVYNNILVGCGDGWNGAIYHSNGHAVFYNNILYNNQGKGIQLLDSGDILSSKAINNVIVNATAITDEYVTGDRHTFDSNAYFNGSATSIPASDSNAITSDPMITVDSTAYTPVIIDKDSPLIDSGSDEVSSTVTHDFYGNKRMGINEIGAVEYGNLEIISARPTITLKGANPQVLIVNEIYAELGATASDDVDGDVTANIVIDTSGVDMTTVGSYLVTYNVSDSDGNVALEATRTLNVVAAADVVTPIITLIGANPQVLTVNENYIELGATANDDVDGDITTNIAIDTSGVDMTTVGSYLVTYNVSDSDGNAALEATRTLNVVAADDVVAPIITLIGADPQVLTVNENYIELGATANDDVDGDITTNIVIDTSGVDMTTVGSYLVTYNVSDSNGNAALEATRTLNVVASLNDSSGGGVLGAWFLVFLVVLINKQYARLHQYKS